MEDTAVLEPQTDTEILNAPETGAVDGGTPPQPVESAQPVADGSPSTPTEAAAPAAPAEPEEEEFPAAPTEALTVRALNEKLAKSPQLAAAVASDPALKNLLYSTARQAAKASEFKSVFANIDTARTALALAQQHNEFQSLYNNPRSAGQALEHLALARNPDGTPRMGADGQPEVNPAYFELVRNYREQLYTYATQSGDPAVAAAVVTLAQFMGDKPSAGGTQADPAVGAQADPAVQAQLQRLAQFEQQESQRSEQAQQEHIKAIHTGIDTAIKEDITTMLTRLRTAQNVALTPYMEKNLVANILADIYQRGSEDKAYQAHSNFVYRSSQNDPDRGVAKAIGAARGFAKEHLTELVRKHLSEISQPVLAAQAEKAQKVGAQAARPNPKGGGGVGAPSLPGIYQKVQDFVATHKRQPTDREKLDL